MDGIDPQKLDHLRSGFWKMEEPARNPQPGTAAEYRRDLAAMGLNLNDDATYELIKDGLTRQKFDDLESLALSYFITNAFHGTQNLSWQQYRGIPAASKHQRTKDLIRYLDHYKERLDKLTLPADADPYHRATLKMLMDDYSSGRLQEYCADLGVDAAVEAYRSMEKSWSNFSDAVRKGGDDRNRLRPLDMIYEIKEIGEISGALAPHRRDRFFSSAGTSQEVLEQRHKEIILAVVRELLINDPAPVPRYVSGHTSDYVYQYALQELEDAGVDMADEGTYRAIGMDRQIFWGNYARQAAHLSRWTNPPKIFRPPPAPDL